MNTIDFIFSICAAVAMIGLTTLVVAFCLAAIFGLWRILTEDTNDD